MIIFHSILLVLTATAIPLFWLEHSFLAAVALYFACSGWFGLAMGRVFNHHPLITGPISAIRSTPSGPRDNRPPPPPSPWRDEWRCIGLS